MEARTPQDDDIGQADRTRRKGGGPSVLALHIHLFM